MQIERLIEPVEKVETPQCEAIRVTDYANDADKTDRQCKWASRYIINGRYLCSKHAGPVALEILLNQSQ